jgi:hypothetical protein
MKYPEEKQALQVFLELSVVIWELVSLGKQPDCLRGMSPCADNELEENERTCAHE